MPQELVHTVLAFYNGSHKNSPKSNTHNTYIGIPIQSKNCLTQVGVLEIQMGGVEGLDIKILLVSMWNVSRRSLLKDTPVQNKIKLQYIQVKLVLSYFWHTFTIGRVQKQVQQIVKSARKITSIKLKLFYIGHRATFGTILLLYEDHRSIKKLKNIDRMHLRSFSAYSSCTGL